MNFSPRSLSRALIRPKFTGQDVLTRLFLAQTKFRHTHPSYVQFIMITPWLVFTSCYRSKPPRHSHLISSSSTHPHTWIVPARPILVSRSNRTFVHTSKGVGI